MGPLFQVGIGNVLGKDLDGDRASEAGIGRLVDLAMPPTPIWAVTSYGPRRVPGLRANAGDYKGEIRARSSLLSRQTPKVSPDVHVAIVYLSQPSTSPAIQRPVYGSSVNGLNTLSPGRLKS